MSQRTESGSEGPAGHGARRLVDDAKVSWRVFLAIGGFLALMGGIYWGTAYEDAGTVMLLVAAVLALWVATFLWLKQREAGAVEAAEAPRELAVPGEAPAVGGAPAAAPAPVEEQYLPHASVWPFLIGVGAAGLGVGLVLGWWVVAPGVALLALGIGGFVRQTRRRD